mmetsp:Transcript_75789/g.214463  ORF Transcript_75789/g.214463 Transcript_75789/m.214463 type:complete len:279 (-) Transcript_75789:248-1084(-)
MRLVRGSLAGDALDEHADGHARGKSVGVEEDVGRNAALREGHVLLRPEQAHDALLAVARGELVADHGVPRVPELEQQPLAGALLQGRAVHERGLLHVAGLLLVVGLDLAAAVVVHGAVERVAPAQVGAHGRQAVGVELRRREAAALWRVREAALAPLLGAVALARGLDDLGLVDLALGEAAVVGSLADDHRVLHVVARVRDHRHHGVGAHRVQVAVRSLVHLGPHQRPLGVHDAEDLIVGPVDVVVVGRAHGLLEHLTLVHVPRALVVIREGREPREK